MTASAELLQIANTLILVDPDAFERLHRLAREVARMEHTLGEMVAHAQQVEQMSRGLKPGGEISEPLLERALRLSSREKL